MANSIKEYTTVADATYVYTTPEYLESTDIKVLLDDVVQQPDAYTLNNTSLTLNTAPADGQTLKIERRTYDTQRLVDYTDGSLLNAETLDLDSTQLFYVAQEAAERSDDAVEEAKQTLLAASTFYKSAVYAPTDPVAGDLWYDLSEAPYQLKIWDGTAWRTNAPLITKFKHYVTQAEIDAAVGGTGIFIAPFNMFIEEQTEVYLNGIKLSEGAYAPLPDESLGSSFELYPDFLRLADLNAGLIDWFYSEQYQGYLFRADLNDSDIIEIHLASNSQYYSEIKISEANVIQLESSVTQAASDAIAKYDQVLAISNDFLAQNYHTTAVNAANDAEAAEAAAQSYAANAQQSATTASVLAHQAQDVIAGWVTLDQQTIHTQGATNPTINSTTGFDIFTTEGVTINHIPLPLYKGMLTLGGSPSLFYHRPAGHYPLYCEKVAGGVYTIWLNQQTNSSGQSVVGSGNMLTETPDIQQSNTVYNNANDYNVMCFYQGNAFCRYKIEKLSLIHI